MDHSANVWVNGKIAVEHEGGYTPSAATSPTASTAEARRPSFVRAYDDPADLAKPRGKQDWQLEPHSIWYPRTTGIWQTVWMERVPATYIGYVRWTPVVERWEIGFEARLCGDRRDGLRMTVKLSFARSADRRRHVYGGRGRSPPPHRAVGSRNRRLPQRAALDPASRRT